MQWNSALAAQIVLLEGGFVDRLRRSEAAAVKSNHSLRNAVPINMDDRNPGQIVPLAEFQCRHCVSETSGIFEAGRPFIHVTEEQPGFNILEDGFHGTTGEVPSPTMSTKQDAGRRKIFARKRIN